jgi:hypothetical protein
MVQLGGDARHEHGQPHFVRASPPIYALSFSVSGWPFEPDEFTYALLAHYGTTVGADTDETPWSEPERARVAEWDRNGELGFIVMLCPHAVDYWLQQGSLVEIRDRAIAAELRAAAEAASIASGPTAEQL